MSHSNASVAPLVSEHIALLAEMEMQAGVLDLACGSGRNGLFVLRHNIPVTFADNNESLLDEIAQQVQGNSAATTWLVDFELPQSQALAGREYNAILVFNYLHRPLLKQIRDAVRPGGLVFYETFTTAQRQFGRPNNPDYLLRPDELRNEFNSWQLLHYFEGERQQPKRAAASLIARKP